jgi:DHA2 family multidrug resistance protein
MSRALTLAAHPINPADMATATKVFAFATMCIGMFIALLDIQIVSASLRDIGGGLSAGTDETAWVQTSYLIAEIIVIPLSGWLSRVFSTRWLFCASAVGFTLASLLCGIAWNIQSMIAFRALQGFLGGSMIRWCSPRRSPSSLGKQRVIAAATIGAVASLAPTLGPGDRRLDHRSLRRGSGCSIINLVPGIFVSCGGADAGEDRCPRLEAVAARGRGLPRAWCCSSLFLGCLEYTLEEGPRWNWFSDQTILTTAWISGLAGIAFIGRTLHVANPIVDLRALKDRNFALGCFFSFVTGIGLFATIYLTPLFLGRVRGYSALDIGLAVFSTGVFQIMAIPLYAFLANRIDLRWIMMVGLGLFAVSMWEFSPITHDWGAGQLMLPQALRGIAQQLAVPPAVTLTLGGLAPARLKHASGLFNLMRNLGGAIGIAACATILNDRTNLHFTRLAEHLNSSNEALNQWLSEVGSNLATLGQSGDVGVTGALRQLWLLTYREAQTQTYGDTFLMIMVCFIIATAMVPLMRKVQPPAAPSADAH